MADPGHPHQPGRTQVKDTGNSSCHLSGPLRNGFLLPVCCIGHRACNLMHGMMSVVLLSVTHVQK